MSSQNNDTRPALRTPRFVFGSSNPSGESSTPRFAATPRFILAGRKQQEDLPGDEIHSDGGSQPGQDRPERGSVHLEDEFQSTQTRLEIPDSDDDGELSPGSSPIHDGYMEIEDPENEYHSFYAQSPSRQQPKRRRLSESPTRTYQAHRSDRPEIDQIASSPSATSENSRGDDTSQLRDSIASPPAPRPASTQLGAVSSQFPPPSSRYPRFTLDPNSQAPSGPAGPIPASQPASTPQRKRQFILPVTPSRRPQNESTTTPRANPLFSPSTTGRGRQRRSTNRDYIQGGMAAELRNWIFELNATKQVSQFPQTQHSQLGSTQAGVASTQNQHYFVTEVLDVVTTVPSPSNQSSRSTGPGHAAPATLIFTPEPHEQVPSSRKILLFGTPVSSPVRPQDRVSAAEAAVGRGDSVGVRKGIVWDMDITRIESALNNNTDMVPASEKWLVGLEWDILSRSST